MIEFGRDANQIFHTFRHLEDAGLSRSDVEPVILAVLLKIEKTLATGDYVGHVQVKGVALEFRAYKFASGDIHVGRITVP